MSHSIEAWVIVFAAATASLVLIQVILLGGILFLFWRGFLKLRSLQQRFRGDGIDPYQIVLQMHVLLNDAEKTAQAGLELGVSANELVKKSTDLLNRTEESVRSIREFVDCKWAKVLHSVGESVHEFRAVAAGVRSLIGVLTGYPNGR